jgi:hypothetical protein
MRIFPGAVDFAWHRYGARATKILHYETNVFNTTTRLYYGAV